MKTAITVILIIVAVAAVLFFLPLIIMFFSYVFGIDMDEDGGLHECIGCPNESDYCTEECRIYKKYQKRLARMEEDKEQERYLQEYANSYTCRTLDNGTAILSHISLTRRWFSAHIKCPFSYCSYPCVSNKKNKMTHKTS